MFARSSCTSRVYDGFKLPRRAGTGSRTSGPADPLLISVAIMILKVRVNQWLQSRSLYLSPEREGEVFVCILYYLTAKVQPHLMPGLLWTLYICSHQ